MTLLLLPVGILLPTLSGWLLVRLFEGRAPALLRLERVALGFLLGLTLTMFLSFLAHVLLSVPLTLVGFLGVQLFLTILVVVLARRKNLLSLPERIVLPPSSLSRTMWIIVALLGAWTVVKIATGFFLLTLSPPFFDDALDNWNFRGKIIVSTGQLMSEDMQTLTSNTNSYPPTVPLAKAWLSSLVGGWDEGLSNSLHPLWFLALLILLFSLLRRRLPLPYALLGTYLLTSMPIALIHGLAPYADTFMSAHILAALGLLFSAATAETEKKRAAFLRLSALAAGVLPFTKNEALIIHLPVLLLLLLLLLEQWVRAHGWKAMMALQVVLRYAVCIAATGIPWVAFKWWHGLTFGNAKGITNLAFGWHENVLFSIFINIFFEGSWLLFFPFLIGLILLEWRTALREAPVLFTAYVLIVFVGQVSIYLFTPLATEAIMQTGFARGVVQLLPVCVALFVMLLASLLRRKNLGANL